MKTEQTELELELKRQWWKKRNEPINKIAAEKHKLKNKLLNSQDPASQELAKKFTTYIPPKINTYR